MEEEAFLDDELPTNYAWESTAAYIRRKQRERRARNATIAVAAEEIWNYSRLLNTYILTNSCISLNNVA